MFCFFFKWMWFLIYWLVCEPELWRNLVLHIVQNFQKLIAWYETENSKLSLDQNNRVLIQTNSDLSTEVSAWQYDATIWSIFPIIIVTLWELINIFTRETVHVFCLSQAKQFHCSWKHLLRNKEATRIKQYLKQFSRPLIKAICNLHVSSSIIEMYDLQNIITYWFCPFLS